MTIQRTTRYEAARSTAFAEWLKREAKGDTIRHCIQCGRCSAACPLSSYMEYSPRRIINLANEGFKDEVLSSFSIWLCASCYACSAECPKQVKITDIMYALKRKAIQERVYPKRFPIPVLAKEFFRMATSRGRITETPLVVVLFLKTNWFRFLSMMGLGLNLIRTGRLMLRLDKIKRRKELQTIVRLIYAQKGES